MLKYGFSIRTRSGQKIDGIAIMGRDQADAERKLFQMYRHCDVLRCDILGTEGRQPGDRSRNAASMEELLTLISK